MSNFYEILGIANPVMDHIICVTEEYLSIIPGKKGGMIEVDYETFVEIIQKSGTQPTLIAGGSGSNTIKGLANLGQRCALVGMIGTDSIAKQFLESIQELGITPLFHISSSPTTQVLCLITPDGERTLRGLLGASQEMTGSNLNPTTFQGVKLVHIEGYTLLNETLTEKAMILAKEAGAKISFDIASFEIAGQYKEKIIYLISRYVDVLFANAEETTTLTQTTPEKGCEVLKELCETVVVLRGKQGCIIGSKDKTILCPAFPIDNPLDTTGAGDLFASGFLHGYLTQQSLTECARYGAVTASSVVQIIGAEIPSHEWPNIKAKMRLNQTPS